MFVSNYTIFMQLKSGRFCFVPLVFFIYCSESFQVDQLLRDRVSSIGKLETTWLPIKSPCIFAFIILSWSAFCPQFGLVTHASDCNICDLCNLCFSSLAYNLRLIYDYNWQGRKFEFWPKHEAHICDNIGHKAITDNRCISHRTGSDVKLMCFENYWASISIKKNDIHCKPSDLNYDSYWNVEQVVCRVISHAIFPMHLREAFHIPNPVLFWD